MEKKSRIAAALLALAVAFVPTAAADPLPVPVPEDLCGPITKPVCDVVASVTAYALATVAWLLAYVNDVHNCVMTQPILSCV